jgi:protein translocase SEC61 complex gamma subunit
MGLRDFLNQCAKTMKLATKPGRSELWLSIKICLLGIGAVGLVGFVIKLLSSLFQPGTPATGFIMKLLCALFLPGTTAI